MHVFTKKDRSHGVKDAELRYQLKLAAQEREREIRLQEEAAARAARAAVREHAQAESRAEFEAQRLQQALTRADGEPPVAAAGRVLDHFGLVVVRNGVEFLDGKVATHRLKIMAANRMLKGNGYPQIADSLEWVV